MKTLQDFNFKDKKAIIRVDFNVPLNDKFEVTDAILSNATRGLSETDRLATFTSCARSNCQLPSPINVIESVIATISWAMNPLLLFITV